MAHPGDLFVVFYQCRNAKNVLINVYMLINLPVLAAKENSLARPNNYTCLFLML